jgi:shikimate dehydrogenase
MNPSHADECIVPGEVIDACSNVFDLVYNPRDTLLVKQARQSGKNARSGMAMLVYQAVAAVDIWEELDDRFDDDMIMDLIRAFEKEFDN